MLIPFLSYSQKTYVPDDIFEAYLEATGYGDGIGFNDSVITSALANIYSLSIDNLSISDLTGINDMVGLGNLYAYNNNLSGTIDFSSFNTLQYISLDNNQISQVILPDSVSYSGTMNLSLTNNIITSIFFPQTLRVNSISMQNNPLDSIDVSTLYDLSYFRISNTNISSLDLSNNNNLYAVEAYDNTLLTSLDLKNKNNLYEIRIYNNVSLNAFDMRNIDLFGL